MIIKRWTGESKESNKSPQDFYDSLAKQSANNRRALGNTDIIQYKYSKYQA